MVLSKGDEEKSEGDNVLDITAAKKRRIRRKKLKAARTASEKEILLIDNIESLNVDSNIISTDSIVPNKNIQNLQTVYEYQDLGDVKSRQSNKELDSNLLKLEMSSKETSSKSREDVIAAREAKKLAKQKAKTKVEAPNEMKKETAPVKTEKEQKTNTAALKENTPKKETPKIDPSKVQNKVESPKSKDEVDRVHNTVEKSLGDIEKTKEQILAERAAKKAAKQAKRKGEEVGDLAVNVDMTVKDVVETLKDIKNVARDVQNITAKVSAINLEAKKVPDVSKAEESGKSKAELRAERRAKQEAQRAAKQQASEQKVISIPKSEPAKAKPEVTMTTVDKEKSPKPKDKVKIKANGNRVNWFQHLSAEYEKETLKKVTINSNLHPAITKLGVQLASRVVTGSNARCIALLDALKKMVRDYTLPAKTEFARGLEAHLTASLDFLWKMRRPTASQTNAVKYFRHHLTQLPNNVDEFDAKKTLQEEIDKYIEDQIDKAGEAISMAVRNKISKGDNILTYGSSSLIERILREAWEAQVQFRAVIVGNRVHGRAREMLRRLATTGLPCTYVDITALSCVMTTVSKVVVGAGSLLANGSVLGALGTAQVALAARAHNVPVLVACETHKFSEQVHTDAFLYNELGDPDELIDQSDENSPLKDWRSNPNLTPLNLTYDVTPPSLVTAVVTEKAILPCTSAPVVLRTYNI